MRSFLAPVQYKQILARLEDNFLANVAHSLILRKYCFYIMVGKQKNKEGIVQLRPGMQEAF